MPAARNLQDRERIRLIDRSVGVRNCYCEATPGRRKDFVHLKILKILWSTRIETSEMESRPRLLLREKSTARLLFLFTVFGSSTSFQLTSVFFSHRFSTSLQPPVFFFHIIPAPATSSSPANRVIFFDKYICEFDLILLRIVYGSVRLIMLKHFISSY